MSALNYYDRASMGEFEDEEYTETEVGEEDEIINKPAAEGRRSKRRGAPDYDRQDSMVMTDLDKSKHKGFDPAGSSMSFGQWSCSDFKSWTCFTCTFVNDNPMYLTCECCGQDRPPKLSPGQPAGNKNALLGSGDDSDGEEDLFGKQKRDMEEMQTQQLMNSRYKQVMKLQNQALQDVNDPGKVNHSENACSEDKLVEESQKGLEGLCIGGDDTKVERNGFVSEDSMLNILQDQLSHFKNDAASVSAPGQTAKGNNDSLLPPSADDGDEEPLIFDMMDESFINEQKRIMELLSKGS